VFILLNTYARSLRVINDTQNSMTCYYKISFGLFHLIISDTSDTTVHPLNDPLSVCKDKYIIVHTKHVLAVVIDPLMQVFISELNMKAVTI
jgi:hypothetical protein